MLRVFTTLREMRADSDGSRRTRRGQPWVPDEVRMLIGMFKGGRSLGWLAADLQRPANGIVAKLRSAGLVTCDISGRTVCYRRGPPAPEHIIKETDMPATTKNIEITVMIRGENAASKSDDQIFDLIAYLEGLIRSLDGVDHKPKKLLARIDALKSDISKLVEYVDSRED